MHQVRGVRGVVGAIGHRDIQQSIEREREREKEKDIPSCLYSSIVFFSPSLKPSVLEAARSSWWSAIVVVGVLGGGMYVLQYA